MILATVLLQGFSSTYCTVFHSSVFPFSFFALLRGPFPFTPCLPLFPCIPSLTFLSPCFFLSDFYLSSIPLLLPYSSISLYISARLPLPFLAPLSFLPLLRSLIISSFSLLYSPSYFPFLLSPSFSFHSPYPPPFLSPELYIAPEFPSGDVCIIHENNRLRPWRPPFSSARELDPPESAGQSMINSRTSLFVTASPAQTQQLFWARIAILH